MKQKTSLLLTVLGIVIYSAASAQKPALFIKGGANFSNITTTNDGSVDDNKSLVGFHVGLQGDLPLASFFSIQPGVFFTTKGSKTEAGKSTDANYYKATTNPMYIEVPVNFVFKLPVGEQSKFFVGAGPYLGIGVAGKNKVEGKILGNSFSSSKSIEWSDDDITTTNYEENAGYGIMRRFDYGLNGTVGIEGNKALISVNYGYGLAKLQSGTDSQADDKNKNRVISLTLGFKL